MSTRNMVYDVCFFQRLNQHVFVIQKESPEPKRSYQIFRIYQLIVKALLSRIIRRWLSDCPGITTMSRSPPPRSPSATPRDSSTRIPPLNPCCVLRCAILLEAFFSFHPFSCLPIFFWGQTCLLICTLHAMLRSNVPSQPYFYLQYPQHKHCMWNNLKFEPQPYFQFLVISVSKERNQCHESFLVFAKGVFTSEQVLGEYFH